MASSPENISTPQPVVIQPPKPLMGRLAALLRDWERSKATLKRKGNESEAMVLEIAGQQLFQVVTAFRRESQAFNAQLAIAKAAKAKREVETEKVGSN